MCLLKLLTKKTEVKNTNICYCAICYVCIYVMHKEVGQFSFLRRKNTKF